MKRKMLIAAAAVTLALGVGATTANAAPKGRPATAPDVACMQAGIATLKDAGLLSTVAKSGLPIETAVSVGVTVRPGADISGVPDPIPFPVVLADHRAGANSLFIYPWCS
jgi:hypothetical protein